MDVSWQFPAPSQHRHSPRTGLCCLPAWLLRGHIPWNTSPSRGLGLQRGRKPGWIPSLQGGTFPGGFHGPFPSTDCTDTNFILQVLKAQKRGPHWCGEGADPAMPVAVSSCRGRGGFGTPKPPGLCPLGRVPAPAGDAAVACGCQAGLSPAPSPGAGGDCPHSGLTLPPTSQASAGTPPGWGLSPGLPSPSWASALIPQGAVGAQRGPQGPGKGQ